MTIDFKKVLVRVFAAVVMLGIFAYIFWPQEKNIQDSVDTVPVIIESTTTTTSIVSIDETTTTMPVYIADPPCLVLYQKNKDIPSLESIPCIESYVQKYLNNYYSKLNIVCRSSGDGNTVSRDELSLSRMESLQFTLMQKNVLYEDIIALSLGDKSPYPGVDPNTEDGKIINRSCEITGVIE